MQLRGLKVHFQEDAELMRGAGPCGCLHGSSSRAGSGTLPRATSTPTKVSGLQGKTRPQEPREVWWEGLPSSGAAAPSLVLCFGRPSAFGEASGRGSRGCRPAGSSGSCQLRSFLRTSLWRSGLSRTQPGELGAGESGIYQNVF